MVSLMSDSRVAFLLWFISIAILVAAVLIFIEIRLKKKREMESVKKKEETPIDRMHVFLAKDVSVREKLDIISRTAKDYFKKEYGVSERTDYGELAKKFKDQGRELEVKFCNDIFEAYYSNHELTDKKIEDLANMLDEICRKKKVTEKLSNPPGFWDRLDGFLEEKRDRIFGGIERRVKTREEKLERKARIEAREKHELLGWVRNAILMGYDKMKIFDLLDDGKRSKKEVKKVLKVYDKEAKIAEKQLQNKVMVSGGGSGIAQKIIQNEKDRLVQAEASQGN